MYAAFNKQRSGDSKLFQFNLVDADVKLFGCNEGWIPWLLEMGPSNGQQGWHVSIPEALRLREAKQYADKHYHKDVNAILINIKPGSKEPFLCELLDVWGFSSVDWTPMLWHLRVLEPVGECPLPFGDFLASNNGDDVYEFLYAMGTVRDGKLEGSWAPPKSSPTNGALLYPDALKYFIGCIHSRTLAAGG